MFVLAELKDTVRIPPWQFEKKLNDAVDLELNKKFSNKVVMNLGLCIMLFDITKLDESFIFPGDGSSHTQVHFRFVVFRPFIDEILIGRIKSSSSEGINVTLGFFEDIFIPADSLQQPSRFNADEQVWIWEYETEEGNHDLFMDTDEEIRFRIVDEIFVDTSPSGPEKAENSENVEAKEKKVPYSLLGSISESGLGLLSWWS